MITFEQACSIAMGYMANTRRIVDKAADMGDSWAFDPFDPDDDAMHPTPGNSLRFKIMKEDGAIAWVGSAPTEEFFRIGEALSSRPIAILANGIDKA